MRRPRARDFDARPLLDLAEDTGGRAEILKGLEREHGDAIACKEAVESIAMTLRHRYLVGYEPDGGKRGWRKIQVEVDRPSTHGAGPQGLLRGELTRMHPGSRLRGAEVNPAPLICGVASLRRGSSLAYDEYASLLAIRAPSAGVLLGRAPGPVVIVDTASGRGG